MNSSEREKKSSLLASETRTKNAICYNYVRMWGAQYGEQMYRVDLKDAMYF